MRPQQQNRRIPPRRPGSNNSPMRRPPNPLSRSYESSGPEVKIRGNAQHIADKYLALARDAQALGDRILAESYLQHAEHYIRIILAAQEDGQAVRPMRGGMDAEDSAPSSYNSAPAYVSRNNADESDEPAPQPVISGVPGEVALMGRNGGYKDNSDGDDEGSPYDRRQPRRRLPARRNAPPRRPFRSEMEEGGEQPGFNAITPMSASDGGAPVRRPRLRDESDGIAAERPVHRLRFAAPAPAAEVSEQPSPRLGITESADSADSARSEAREDDNAPVPAPRIDTAAEAETVSAPRASASEETASPAAAEVKAEEESAPVHHRRARAASADAEENDGEEAKPVRRARRTAAEASDADSAEPPVKRGRGRPRRKIVPLGPETSEQPDIG